MEEHRDILRLLHASSYYPEAPEKHEQLLSSCYSLIARLIRQRQEAGKNQPRY